MPKQKNGSPGVEDTSKKNQDLSENDVPEDSALDEAADEQDVRRTGNQANQKKAGENVGKAQDGGNKGSLADKDDADIDAGDSLLDGSNRGVGRVGNPSFNAATPVDGTGITSGGSSNSLSGAGKFVGGKLKGFGSGMKTAIGGGLPMLGKSIASGFAGAGGGITHVVSTVTSKVGGALGIPQMAAGILIGTLAFGGIAGGGLAYLNYSYEQEMMRQEIVVTDDCSEDVAAAASTATFDGDEDQMVYENAAKAWAVMKAIGLTDEQAAGAIGNMIGEGGLSPYTMECDFLDAPNEKWYIGPIKEGFIADLNGWTENFVFPHYASSGIPLNTAFYRTSRHGAVAGVGLCGFTGCNYDDLEDWAAGMNTTWYDEEKAFDVQISFIIAPTANGGYGGPGGAADWLRNWGNDTSGCSTPEDAATVFCLKFEGNSLIADTKLTAARQWYNEFAGTMGDTSYAQSILELANVTQAGAAANAANSAAEDCGVESAEYDNSDLARAAVAYAYETTDEGRGNDGTELYQYVHRAIWGSDPYFQSCDRGVSTAVQWCDADNSFPIGPCTSILSYCQGSSKWEYVGKGVQLQDAGELQPGDVCVCTGHVVMYVGHDIIAEKFPNSDASSDFVSASLNERSPGCGHVDFHYDTRDYYVFRLTQYDNSGTWINIASGMNLNDR